MSPAEAVVQKYRQGAVAENSRSTKEGGTGAASDRPPSLSAGDKFRDLLTRLQNLGEEFADSPVGSIYG
ncbi:hypothetical protein RvY_10929 [Ramazzottius varieornatus]|uniref:Uncharacterized protein n=1 Tax=Ramazzottius varieornatus TaxID=947166 RepID=A0A1D1VED8_RAMVA|nr:hypothetical protein RvY_10929 [Ramazzottius varieornatus]